MWVKLFRKRRRTVFLDTDSSITHELMWLLCPSSKRSVGFLHCYCSYSPNKWNKNHPSIDKKHISPYSISLQRNKKCQETNFVWQTNDTALTFLFLLQAYNFLLVWWIGRKTTLIVIETVKRFICQFSSHF